MQRHDFDPFEYANKITQANPKGILLTTAADGKVDTMVIGWGMIGTVWSIPTFIAFVRTSRHTYDLLEQTGEFTINIPHERLDPRVMKIAGLQSGRHVDKIAELGLTLVESEVVAAPAIAEAPITLECQVMYKQLFDASAMPEDILINNYPADVTDIDALGSCYQHVAYYSEIVASYVLED